MENLIESGSLAENSAAYSRELANCQGLLLQLNRFIQSFDSSLYSKRPGVSGVSTIGAHVRHTLEFYELFLEGLPNREITYDLRRRDTQIESDPEAAKQKILGLMSSFESISDRYPADLRVYVLASVSIWGNSVSYTSSVGRELLYLGEHSIHHMGMLSLIAKIHGVTVPDEFGKAYSTLKYEAVNACRS